MFKSLRLERFKNFKDAQLELGPFTVLIGANASGKSNVRDAFRFLHGVAQGYELTEIIDGKFAERGQCLWACIKGGCREIAFSGKNSFALTGESTIPADMINFSGEVESGQETVRYRIEVAIDRRVPIPRIRSESLGLGSLGRIFTSEVRNRTHQVVRVREYGLATDSFQKLYFPKGFPVLGQMAVAAKRPAEHAAVWHGFSTRFHDPAADFQELSQDLDRVLIVYRSCRFFHWSLDALCQPCLPGHDRLSDDGSNLSSVLLAICAAPAPKMNLLSWVQELTSMDTVDFEFPADPTGKILATIVERNGRKTTFASASDGTLRFLAFLAALLGPNPSSFYFFEELENGIHPSRLNLLLDLIETQVKEKGIQVVATTHSPELLARLSKPALEHASLVYRSPEAPDSRIVRVLDLPEAGRVLQHNKTATLFSAGWFETMAHFSEPNGKGSIRTAYGSEIS
jgi:predicted ATPase